MTVLSAAGKTRSLRNMGSILALSVCFLLTLAGMASAEMVLNQPSISVTATSTGVVENGIRFFVYDGGPFTMVDVDGIKVPSLDAREGSSSRYLYIWVDDKAAFDGPFKAEITFTYMAPKTGKFRLLYDNKVTGDRYTDSGYVDVKPEDVGKWVSYTFKLENVMLSNRAASGAADMRLHTTPNLPFYVRSIEMKLTPQ